MLSRLNIKPLKNRRRLLRKDETKAEHELWKYLRNKQLGYRFVRQFSVDNYVIDFYCPEKRLGIEIEGGIHLKKENRVYDKYRESYISSFNIKIIKFPNEMVLRQLNQILEKVKSELTPLIPLS